jgi:hypothetical protein
MLLPIPRAQPDDERLNPHLGAALAAAADRIAPSSVDQVWLFPARKIAAKETGLAVLVVTAGEGEAKDRRAIHTLRYEAEAGKGGKAARHDLLEEQGTVPPDRVGRIVDGVVRRLAGGEADAPDIRELGGSVDAWNELLRELGAPPPPPPVLDPANR